MFWTASFRGVRSSRPVKRVRSQPTRLPVAAGNVGASPAPLKGAGAPDRARQPQSLSLEEVDRFLASVQIPWAKAALTLQVTCGLRTGEVLALRAKDLDLDEQTVTIAGTVAKVGERAPRTLAVQDPKTAASFRTLSLLPGMVGDLAPWRRSRGN